MEGRDDVNGQYKVRWNGDGVYIDGGCNPVRIPDGTAAKSSLLKELREGKCESEAVFLTPLARKDINAWLKVAHAVTDSLDSDSAEQARSLRGKKRLARALKAANFLKDDFTVALVIQDLARSMLRVPKGAAHDTLHDAPDAGQAQAIQIRAQTVLGLVPPDAVPDILAAALRQRSGSAEPGGSPLHDCNTAFALLELLPTSFHPALMHAYCKWTGNGDTLVAHHLPRCERTACAARHLENLDWAKPEWHGGGLPPDNAPHCASGTFQFLAAAAPLAGGQRERAWELPGTCGLTVKSEMDQNYKGAAPPAAAGTSARLKRGTKRKRVSEKTAAGSKRVQAAEAACHVPQCADDRAETSSSMMTARELPAAMGKLAALDVKFSFGEEEEPERWCNALAELQSLRRLSVAVPNVDMISSVELASALQQLTCLDTLSIDCGSIRVFTNSFWPIPFDNYNMQTVYQGICKLQQLSSLSLKGRQYAESEPCVFGGMFESPYKQAERPGFLDEMVRGISRLTRLTSMKFQCNVFGQRGTGVLAATLGQMSSLREVHADVRPCSSEVVRTWGECVEALMENVCTSPTMNSLQSFGVRGVSLSPKSSFPLERLHRRISKRNAGLLARMTALHLPNTQVDAAHCVSLLAATPYLQSLCLAKNKLEDSGLQAVAGALAELPGLTRLDVSSNQATDRGVFAILMALHAADGCARVLRDLNICSTAIHSTSVQELAGILQHFPCLEQCGLAKLGLSEAGVAVVSEALTALPGLRFLYKGCNVERAQVFAEAVLQKALATALGRLQMEMLYLDGCSMIPYEPELVTFA